MKRNIPGIILLLSVASVCQAQIQEMPADSISHYLCKKWGVKAIYMGGQPINSTGETVTYEFKPDHTFVRVTDKKSEKGTWTHEPENKMIHLQIKKKTNIYIASLKENEFSLSPTQLADPSNNALGIRVVLEPVK
jgi:hypothetical protein